jgi:hypothetical protein
MHSFVIHVEAGSILPDGSGCVRHPLVEVVERSGQAHRVAKKLVGIQIASVPIVSRVSMKLVRP